MAITDIQKNVPDFSTIIGSLNQTPILNTYYNFEDHWLKQSMVFNTFLEEINMDQKTETIITQLKNALERQEPGTNDHQWIMGISINDDRKQCAIDRVVLKTNGSPYVDGMDILFDKMEHSISVSTKPIINSNGILHVTS